MKIVVDDKIPYIKGQIERLADEVLYLPGNAITADDVRDADILIVRTRTHCNERLLQGSRVRLVVTATIGYDHLDIRYLEHAGIRWTNCPGCNATSVAQYVRNSLFLLEHDGKLSAPLSSLTLAIIGVGHVGTAVFEACQPIVGRVMLCDPPKGLQLPLTQIAREADIITLHTPLTHGGECPSFHLLDELFFQNVQRRPVIINAARGGVLNEEALLAAIDDGHISEAIIDTWEDEPTPARALLNKVYLGTPHIAGYSADGKANATRMALEAVRGWLGREEVPIDVKAPALPESMCPAEDPIERALQLYDPRQDSERLKQNPELFEQLRGNYPLRREKFD